MLESKTLSIFHYLEQHEKAYLELENEYNKNQDSLKSVGPEKPR